MAGRAKTVEPIDDRNLRPALQRIKRRRITTMIVWGLLPLVLLFFYASNYSRETRELALLCWVAMYSIATIRMYLSRCPKCFQLFHNPLSWKIPIPNKCQQCGLTLPKPHGP